MGVAGRNIANRSFDQIDFKQKLLNQYEYTDLKTKVFNRYNRFKLVYPSEDFIKGKSYVFFVKPKLNLYENNDLLKGLKSNPFFSELYRNLDDRLILNSLSGSTSQPLLYLLSNKYTNFDMPDISIKTIERGETFKGWKIVYGTNSVDSKCVYSFSVSFTDNRDLQVYKLIKAWIDYIELVNRGTISPSQLSIDKKEIDYVGSIYYFVTGPDGSEIRFYGKYTGVFPTNIPASAFNASNHMVASPQYSINFISTFIEEMNPYIIKEFNNLVQAKRFNSSNIEPTFRADKAFHGETWVRQPCIFTENQLDKNNNHINKLYLKFIK